MMILLFYDSSYYTIIYEKKQGDKDEKSKFGLNVATVAILLGRDAVRAAKDGVKVILVFIANLCCNFGNFQLGIAQQHASGRQSVVIEQLGKGASVLLFQNPRDLLGG